MTVFKNYFKLAKANLTPLIMYGVIFFVIASMSVFTSKKNVSDYVETKPRVALINQDTHLISDGIQQLLEMKADIISVKENELQDALFYREVDAIVHLEKGFGDEFTSNKEATLDVQVTGEAKGDYVKRTITGYLNALKIYDKIDEQVISNVLDIANINTKVSFLTEEGQQAGANGSGENNYYSGLNYPIMAQVLLMVSIVSIIYNDKTLKMRQEVSSFGETKFNIQLLLGHFVLGTLVFLVYVIGGFIFNLLGKPVITNPLYLLNTYIFVLTTVAMSYCLCSVITNKRIVSSLSTVVSLGSSFLSGAFVPQELMDPTILNISKITPSYWFVRNNNLIATKEIPQEFYLNAGILVGFICLFFILTAIVKRVRVNHQQSRA